MAVVPVFCLSAAQQPAHTCCDIPASKFGRLQAATTTDAAIAAQGMLALSTASFCAPCTNNLQVVEEGYEFFARRQLVTIFSAPNYCGEFDNAGAMMSVDDTLMCSFQVRAQLSGDDKLARELARDSACVLCSARLLLVF